MDSEINTTQQDDEKTDDQIFKLSDDELLLQVKKWINESTPFNAELKKAQDTNSDYYNGNQTGLHRIPRYMSKFVNNKIFSSVETVVPIATSRMSEFVAIPAEDSEESIGVAEDTQKMLKGKFDELDVQQKAEIVTRDMLVKQFGVFKLVLDSKRQDFNITTVMPENIFVPRFGRDELEVPYIIERHKFLLPELYEQFGKAKVKNALGSSDTDVEKEAGEPPVKIAWEVTTNEWKVWVLGNGIIKKEANPFFDFEEIDNNYLEFPVKEYVILSLYKNGKSVIGETSLVTQALPIQDVINQISRIVLNHASKTGNGTWMIDSGVMTEKEAKAKITNQPGLIIYGAGAARADLIRRDSPPPLPNYLFNILSQTSSDFDNLFGTHSTTRGERKEQETLGGRRLLREADIGRIDMITRELERAISALGKLALQTMKLYYDDGKIIRVLGEASSVEFINFKREGLSNGMKVFVESGTTMPTDPIALREEALTLWSAQAIDPQTLYERLRIPNSEEKVDRLVKWNQGLNPNEETPETPQLPQTPMPTQKKLQ